MSKKEKLKTFECIEHGEKFLIDAKDINEAQEVAQMYGGSVIREVKSSQLGNNQRLNVDYEVL